MQCKNLLFPLATLLLQFLLTTTTDACQVHLFVDYGDNEPQDTNDHRVVAYGYDYDDDSCIDPNTSAGYGQTKWNTVKAAGGSSPEHNKLSLHSDHGDDFTLKDDDLVADMNLEDDDMISKHKCDGAFSTHTTHTISALCTEHYIYDVESNTLCLAADGTTTEEANPICASENDRRRRLMEGADTITIAVVPKSNTKPALRGRGWW